ncbi:MAG: zf-TFIIB domain-containing protein [Gammaproteobacteria bacterium]
MDCPKCIGELDSHKFQDIEYFRCDACEGLWFDMLVKEDLLAIKGSESIDIGSDNQGEMLEDVREIDCPKCHQRMVQMIDKDQFHIKYECCQNCYGTFFDASEFRDLKEHTVLERFTQMLRTIGHNL